jgi:hypothetical protein
MMRTVVPLIPAIVQMKNVFIPLLIVTIIICAQMIAVMLQLDIVPILKFVVKMTMLVPKTFVLATLVVTIPR